MLPRNHRLTLGSACAALLLGSLSAPSYASPAGSTAGPVSPDVVFAGSADSSAGASAPDQPRSAGHRPAARSVILDGRAGKLTSRPTGMPVGSGSRKLTSATVKQDMLRPGVDATIVLAAAPGPTAYVIVEFGWVIEGSCQGDASFSSPTASPTGGFSRSGRTITLRTAFEDAYYEEWDCAFVALTDGPTSTTPYDVLIGELVDIAAKPVLKVGKPELLNKAKQPIRLVKGVWTYLDVSVGNTGRGNSGKVTLSGKGKGVKVKRTSLAGLSPDDSTTTRIKVKLTRPGKVKLKLIASTSGSKASRTVKLKSVAAPKRPASGAYRNKSGDVTFQIKGGKVVGFRAYVRMTCGGYPDFPTYSMSTLDFPRTAVPRNGIVDRVVREHLYTVSLQLKVSGGKVTSGQFSYHGPDRCWARAAFTAKRR